MTWVKDETFCKEDGCWKPAIKKNWCNAHYLRYYKADAGYKPLDNYFNGEKRKHPLYMMWFERKQGGYLVEKWLDFKAFVEDVSPKPDGDFFLLRIDGSKLYGPDNFRWQTHLKRKEGESNKDWWARKRAARIAANPGMERERSLQRRLGISLKERDARLEVQNFKCAICENEETSIDGKTGSLKTLAVDHCHKSNKIRELLCWRCNGTLGKVEDSIKLLQAMIDYLKKHGASLNV